MKHEETVIVDTDTVKIAIWYLEHEPENEEECQPEDTRISVTAVFDDGTEMDIDCCGVKFLLGESNKSWSQAVLYRNGVEFGRTDPDEAFLDDWKIEAPDGEIYIVHVMADII